MSIDDSTWSLVQQMRNQVNAITDKHTRDATKAWVAAWDDVSAELEAALNDLALEAGDGKITRRMVIRSEKLRKALAAIETKLNTLFEQAGQSAIAELDDIVQKAGTMQARIIGNQLPKTERDIVKGWSNVDAEQVSAIVTRATEQITKRSYPLSDEAVATMRRELVRGLIVGDNPRTTAARMIKRTEGLFNGGLARAVTIARTETLDAHRAAAMVSEKANADIMAGWIWTASLSTRTCPGCWGMNGREFPIEQSGPDGHQNCRCVRVPKTKTWAELGFDIEEPPSLIPDSRAVFNKLPKADQITILGPGRYKAYVGGDFPIDSWATTRSTPGWRDSVVPAKVPA